VKRASLIHTGLGFHEEQQTGPACCTHNINTLRQFTKKNNPSGLDQTDYPNGKFTN